MGILIPLPYIGGSISGAYLGIEAIPDEWIKSIEKTDYLDGLAMRLGERKKDYEKK
jgi:ADP-ribosylglycohydrolase